MKKRKVNSLNVLLIALYILTLLCLSQFIDWRP